MAGGWWERFSSRLSSAADAREPFGEVLRRHWGDGSQARLLIYTPPHETVKARSPASVLALSNQEWLLVEEMADSSVRVTRSGYDRTLWVELTSILLYGALRIAFFTGTGSGSVSVEFNTVARRYYDEAIQRVLDGMDGVEACPPLDPGGWEPLLEPLPLKFRNAFPRFTPPGQRPLALVAWPAVLGARRHWFQHELCPEAVLAFTHRELLLISEEATWTWLRLGRNDKFGFIVTHCPFSRLAGWHLQPGDPLAALELSLRTGRGTDVLRINFPGSRQGEVTRLLERAMTQSPSGNPGRRPAEPA